MSRILKKGSLRPQNVAILDEAYRLALRKLNLVDRGDPITEMVARQVIQAGHAGAPERKSRRPPSRTWGSG